MVVRLAASRPFGLPDLRHSTAVLEAEGWRTPLYLAWHRVGGDGMSHAAYRAGIGRAMRSMSGRRAWLMIGAVVHRLAWSGQAGGGNAAAVSASTSAGLCAPPVHLRLRFDRALTGWLRSRLELAAAVETDRYVAGAGLRIGADDRVLPSAAVRAVSGPCTLTLAAWGRPPALAVGLGCTPSRIGILVEIRHVSGPGTDLLCSVHLAAGGRR
jgi:hypothetical protein